ncbi:molybdopterin cofactor-binding domain-containing protein [Natrialbaceae archaeon A-arb3/5]
MTEPTTEISRRGVLKGSGGALIVGFGLASSTGTTVAVQEEDVDELPGGLQDDAEIDSWIIIEEDETVTVQTGKVELGQGIMTALSQIAADELDVEFDRIEIVTAETGTTPDEGTTAGSLSMEDSGTAITYAAAEARQILLEMAAAEFDVEEAELSVDDGTITDESGNETTYWELLGGDSFDEEATAEVEPKDPDEKEIVGENVPRIDVPGKMTGEESFVHDLRLEGMLHGRVVRPPTYDATLESVDEDEVSDMPGVVDVVRDGDFLGVVAETEWQAIQAMETLQDEAEWDIEEELPEQDELYDYLRDSVTDEPTFGEVGDPEDAIEEASETHEAEYHRPYQMHASLGPSCAVAEIEGDWQDIQAETADLQVWTHSQNVYGLRDALSDLLDKETDHIQCTHMEGSGCYGHNGADDVAGDAALLSEAVDGRPVRVQWMREDEHRWEPYGSAMVMEAQAGLDDDGTIVGWDFDVWSAAHSQRPPGQPLLPARHIEDGLEMEDFEPPDSPTSGSVRNSVPLYEFENQRVTNHFVDESPLRNSALRGLGAYANIFALESFIDELAHEAGSDPVEFRLQHMENERARDVIEAAAEEAEWGDRDLDENQGMGMAFGQYKNVAAYTAVVIQATVDPDSGDVQLDHAIAANDSGEIVSPDGIRHQIAGGVIQSASWTLHEEVDFEPDGVTDEDWADYQILSFSEAPSVDVSLIDRPGEPYLGTGEASQGPTGAAISNAIYDAVGARVRELPITSDRITAAIDD